MVSAKAASRGPAAPAAPAVTRNLRRRMRRLPAVICVTAWLHLVAVGAGFTTAAGPAQAPPADRRGRRTAPGRCVRAAGARLCVPTLPGHDAAQLDCGAHARAAASTRHYLPQGFPM